MTKANNLLKLFKELYKEKGLRPLAKISGLSVQHLWIMYSKDKLSTYDPRLLATLSLEKSDQEIMELVRHDALAIMNKKKPQVRTRPEGG